MAIAFVQAGALVDGSNITSYIWNPVGTAVGVGNCIVGAVSWGSGSSATLTSITDDKGNTYNHSTPVTSGGNTYCAFWLGNITNGPTTLTTTLSAGGSTHRGIFAEYSGSSTASNPTDGFVALVTTGAGTGANACSSGNITTTQNGDTIWGGIIAWSFQAQAAAGTGYTSRGDAGVSQAVWSEDKAQGTAGTTAATFTQPATGDVIVFAIAVAPPAPPSTQAAVAKEIFIPGQRQGPMRGLRSTRAFPPVFAPVQAFPMPDMSWRKRAPAPDLMPFPQFYQTVPQIGPRPMPDVAIASKKPQWIDLSLTTTQATAATPTAFAMPDVATRTKPVHWIDAALALVQAPAAPTAPPVVVAMPDMPVKRKPHWIDAPAQQPPAPTVFYGAPALPARSWRNKQQQWVDVVFPFAPPLPPTPSTAVPIMLDMAQKTKPRQWLDLFLPIQPPAATPSTAAFPLPDMAKASGKQRWLDLFLPIYGPLPQTPTTAAFALPDRSIRTKRQHWTDLLLPIYGPLPQTPSSWPFALPDVSVASRKQQWLDLTQPLFQAPAVVVTPYTFDMRLFDMPMPRKAGRVSLLEQLLGIPPTGACSLLQEDGTSRIILEDGSGFLLLENCTPLITSFFDNRWLDMPVPKRQKWLDLLLPGLFVTTPPAQTPSNWFFSIPDRSVKTKPRQWLDIANVPPLPLISLGAPALCDMSIPSRKEQWIDLSFPITPPPVVVTTPVVLAMPDVSIKTRQRQWLDLFLPVYGPLPRTPSTSAFSMPDMAVKTKQRQWLDYQWAQFVAQPTQTPPFALMSMLEMLPRMNSRKQQWLDLPAVLFYPTLPRTPSSFFDDRWLDMPRPRPFIIEATQGLIGLQTTVPPPVPVPPERVPPRFRRDPWDRDPWGRFKPGSGFHGV